MLGPARRPRAPARDRPPRAVLPRRAAHRARRRVRGGRERRARRSGSLAPRDRHGRRAHRVRLPRLGVAFRRALRALRDHRPRRVDRRDRRRRRARSSTTSRSRLTVDDRVRRRRRALVGLLRHHRPGRRALARAWPTRSPGPLLRATSSPTSTTRRSSGSSCTPSPPSRPSPTRRIRSPRPARAALGLGVRVLPPLGDARAAFASSARSPGSASPARSSWCVVACAAKDVEAMWLVGIEVAILVAVVDRRGRPAQRIPRKPARPLDGFSGSLPDRPRGDPHALGARRDTRGDTQPTKEKTCERERHGAA